MKQSSSANDPLNSYTPKAGGIAARAQARPAHGFFEGLNDEQRLAVETLDGPLLVLAGAGTGKTRVLTTRIAHIIATGRARPGEILSVTFTNKAAHEMRERIGKLMGMTVEGMPWLGTFHAICVKILRRHAELVGLKNGFTILDTDDQIRLLKQILQAENIDDKRWPARQLAHLIDGWKNKGLTPDMIKGGDAFVFADGKADRLYAAYQARLKTLNAVDFGDLLLECIRLFREQPDVLAQYQARFKYMLVDEYQDTNTAQYLWLRLLAQAHHNVCCVGDDDQSIYGWRGAKVENILKFEADFPGAVVIRLERNYRSTPDILAAASHLISHNEGRLGKTLHTDTGLESDPVKVQGVWDSEEEARTIGDEIEAMQHKGVNLNEVAILVRASFQMRAFEDRFVTLGLPYRVIGGPRFYERAEIRDALAYFRVVVSPFDDLAFERIVNVPRRGLGDATLKLVHGLARAEDMPLSLAAAKITEGTEVKPKPRGELKTLTQNFARWRGLIDAMKHTELAEMILEESGYTDMWQKDKSADAQGRLENLKELIRSMEPYETLPSFLEHVALVMDAEGQKDGDKVSIMTLHAAKGLEFDHVFLPGWEEGLFPHQRALDESGKAGLEEERRLAYVGITRARKTAHITFASNRQIHGLWQNSLPSRFLDELPEDNVEVVETGSVAGSYGGYGATKSRFDSLDPFAASYTTPGWQRAKQAETRQKPNYTRQKPLTIEGEVLASSSSTSRYKNGERVFHLKFGYGHIAAIEGNKLTIDFDKAGRKKVLEDFVEKH